MPIEALYVAGPYEGVSQAPPQVRLPGACQDMQDVIATIPNGIQKRPPFEYVGKITTNGRGGGDAFYAEIPRGSPSTDLTLVLNMESLSVVPYLWRTADTALAQIPVTVTVAAQAYLNFNTPSPNLNLRAVSVEDVTFITNRTVPVADSGATSPSRPFEALLWIKTGQYGRNYDVFITPAGGSLVSASYRPGTGATSTDALGVGTDIIAFSLYGGTAGTGGTYSGVSGGLSSLTSMGFTVIITGSTIYISHPTNNFAILSQDDQGGSAMEAIYESVQNFSDLPAVAQDGMIVRVLQSEGGGGNSDFYVQFVASAPPNGAWKECVAPLAPLGVNPQTMPYTLSPVGGTTWTIDVAPWKGRQTGDATLSPDPGFVGDFIEDVKWFRGRLELVYNDGTAFSDSADPYNFYTTTLAVAKDSDPLGFLTPVERKTFFKQGLTFDNRCVVYADKVQAIISSNGPFTADNARSDTLGTYDFNDAVPLQPSNHRVYFSATTSVASLIYELAIDRLSGLALTEELTTAVPFFLPTTLDRAATLQVNYFTVYGSSGASKLYIHVPRYSEQQRVQNAFYEWNLPTGYTLAGMFFKGSILRLALLGPDGNLHQFTAECAPEAIDPGGTVRTYVDLKFPEATCTVSYSGLTGLTKVVTPMAPQAGAFASVRGAGGSNGYPETYLITVDHIDATAVYLKGNWVGATFYIGYLYASYFIPTEWFITGQDGKPQHVARLSLRKLNADVADFGYLRFEINIVGRTVRTVEFQGLYLEDPSRAGSNTPPNSQTRKLPVPINGPSTDTFVKIINDQHVGFKFLGYEWQGDWNPRARRVT